MPYRITGSLKIVVNSNAERERFSDCYEGSKRTRVSSVERKNVPELWGTI